MKYKDLAEPYKPTLKYAMLLLLIKGVITEEEASDVMSKDLSEFSELLRNKTLEEMQTK